MYYLLLLLIYIIAKLQIVAYTQCSLNAMGIQIHKSGVKLNSF